MPPEKATGIVIRTSDWSETSRIATFFTREFGKVRALAKGGRRLKSNFEVALDLLTVCNIVFMRKQSGLDLLTEARVDERFTGMRSNLTALYSGYYIAELLDLGTQDHDPHPNLYDEALRKLRDLNAAKLDLSATTLRFELVWLHELGYRPRFDACAVCSAESPSTPRGWTFSPTAGGILCAKCEIGQSDKRPVSGAVLEKLRELDDPQRDLPAIAPLQRVELRQLLGHYVSHVLARRPYLLTYLE
jgi:DNA repair protein RecO (recombination protein O)